MKHLLVTVGLLTLLTNSPTQALQVEFSELEQEHYRIDLTLEDKDVKFAKVEHEGVMYSKVNFGEGLNQSYVGEPDLPRIHRWIALKSHRPLIAEATFSQLEIVKDILVHPVIADTIDDGRLPEFKIKAPSHAAEWTLKHPLSEGPVTYVGNIPVQPITIAPINYHPASRTLNIYRKITIHLHPSPTVELGALPGPPTSFGLRQVETLALNGKRFTAHRTLGVKKALIVTAPALKSAGQALQTIWTQAGIQTRTLEIDSASTQVTLFGNIQTAYKTNPVDHVLFIGDQTQIPLFKHSNSILGDVGYTYLVGSDEVADVSLGRLPVKTIEEANYLIEKISKYRQLAQQGHTEKNIVMIAHSEDYPGKYTENSETIRKSANPKGLNYIPQYGGKDGTNSTVIANAATGAAIINYRGHGTEYDWSNWDKDDASFDAKEVDQLPDDGKRLPFIFNVACSNGAIQNVEGSFVQKQLIPSLNAPYRGAVGAFGATEPSYTTTNHRFNIHLFAYLQSLSRPTIGEIYTAANNKLVQENGGTAPENVEMYLLFSDPSLRIWNEKAD